MFEDKHGALVPFRDHELTTRKQTEITRYGDQLVEAIDRQIHELAQSMIDVSDGFRVRMTTLQIDAWSDRRSIAEEWMVARRAAEEQLYEAYLRYHKHLLPEGEAIDLLAEAEGVSPSHLQNDYEAFRTFVRDVGHRVQAAQRVLAEDNRRTRLLSMADLKERLDKAEQRFGKKTFGRPHDV